MAGRERRDRQEGRARRASQRRERKAAGWSTAQQTVVDRLFVYGTLRAGQAARSLMANHVIASQPGTVRGRMYALADGYPGFLPGPDGTVLGEMVQLIDLAAAFALLDAYEGDEFVRSLERVSLADQPDPAWAWCYVLARPELIEDAELIESGDWVAYKAGSP